MPATSIPSKNIHVTVEHNAIRARIDSRLIAKAVDIEHRLLKRRIIRRQKQDNTFCPVSAESPSTGGRPEAYYLLSFTEVQYLAATGRKSESVTVWQQMADKVERTMHRACTKALKATPEYQNWLENHHKLTDAIRDSYLPRVARQNPDSSYLNEGGAHNAYSVFARIPALQDRSTPLAMAIGALAESDCVWLMESMPEGAHYKDVYRLCAQQAGALQARHSQALMARCIS